MSVEKAKQFISRLRKETPLRKQFESAWQGRKKWDHDYITEEPPVIPKLMSELAPDQKEYPEEYRKFWGLRYVQEEIHYLLFYKGDYGPFKLNYIEGDSITLKGIAKRIADPYYEENLEFISKLASKLIEENIEAEEFKKAWKDYVCWTYNVIPHYGKNDMVEQLWLKAKKNPNLDKITISLEVSQGWVFSTALMVLYYLEYGFCEENKIIKNFVNALNVISERASEFGFHFSAKEYLGSCIFRADLKPIKRERDEKYWEEDDPNRWLVEPKFVYISFQDND